MSVSRLAEDLMGAISVALRAGDMQGVVGLLKMLAIEDPQAAEVVLSTIELVLSPPGRQQEDRG